MLYKIYVDAKAERELQAVDSSDEDLATPGSNFNSVSDFYEEGLSVNVSLLTNSRELQRKKQKLNTEADDYLDAIRIELNTHDPIINEPLQWWIKHGRTLYPTLYKMALDILAIPATSCECERIFSGAKRTITVDRNSISTALMEATQCQKQWLRREAVKSPLISLTQKIARSEGRSDTKDQSTIDICT